MQTSTLSKQVDVLFKKLGTPKAFGLDAVFRYKVKLPTPRAITLDGQLVIPIKRDIWIGETSNF